MLVFEQVGSAAPRRDKHTPCIKTNRLKRQNRSRAERAVRAKPLGESGPLFSHIGNAIFCPLFHRRIFHQKSTLVECVFSFPSEIKQYLLFPCLARRTPLHGPTLALQINSRTRYYGGPLDSPTNLRWVTDKPYNTNTLFE